MNDIFSISILCTKLIDFMPGNLMKTKKIIPFILLLTAALLTGCRIIREDAFENENTYIPPYATNDSNQLYENTFYIWEDEENGSLLSGINADQLKFADYRKKLFTPLFNIVLQNPDLKVGDPLRIIWMLDTLDGNIPTFYRGSKLVYYSSTSFPASVEIERFYDHGYSVGLYGLAEHGENHYVMSLSNTCGATSDAASISSLLVDEDTIISIPYLGETKLTSEYISSSGTIKGLQKDSQYTLTAYVGSRRYEGSVTANVRIFSSMESFIIPDYTFAGDGLVVYEFPDYMKTGYYYISGYGLFRYIAEESEEKLFDEEKYADTDFNVPIIITSNKGYTIYDPTGYGRTDFSYNDHDALNDSIYATSEYYTVTVRYDNPSYVQDRTLNKVIVDFNFKNSTEVNPPEPRIIYFSMDEDSFSPEDPDNPEEGTFFNPYVYELSEEELAAGRVHLEWNAGNRTDLPVGQYAFVFTNVGSYRSHSESVQAFTAEQYVAYLKGEEIPDETENGTDDVITLNKTEYEDYQKWLEEYRNNMQEDIPEEINETLPTVTEAETATSYTEEETEGESNVESIR